ncbi:uncharacterized protein LOC130641407 [Hydractinia symbiolongicarpus]|uniref:uncharacterized protein LOC130641407 n=1 Tax=Hydractinia symbiolongicarpus TaxID=13093 RepID=UPI002550A73D|nr:uncharacterized protein LOC130641407 [Hydractinia symbiolongicarpus]
MGCLHSSYKRKQWFHRYPGMVMNRFAIQMGIIDEPPPASIKTYCLRLLHLKFFGQTSDGDTDECTDASVLNLGTLLKMLDKYIRSFEDPQNFDGTGEDYIDLLKLIANRRRRFPGESPKKCFNRLLKHSKQFVTVYRSRAADHNMKESESLSDDSYWGTRQQLLGGKIIADWVDASYGGGPLDPIFGVMLNPTVGKVGPGNGSIIHRWLFDNDGCMAYHAAVHDGFGYLKNFHDKGPGYDYLERNYLLSNLNPLAGQRTGICFWKTLLKEEKEREEKEEREGEKAPLIDQYKERIL